MSEGQMGGLRESAFLPDAQGDALTALADEACRCRSALFAGLMLWLGERRPGVEVAALEASFRDLSALPVEERDAAISHPVFSLQLEQMLRLAAEMSDADLRRDAKALAAAYWRTRAALEDPSLLRIGRTEVRRWDTDTVIIDRAPPTYEFPPAQERERRSQSDPYTLEAFTGIAAAAVTRIADVWPALAERFDTYVRMLVHIPDAPYRSASAPRYRGVVFLSSDDVSLLQLEESLVHEFGHQVLYEVMARDPLLVDGGRSDYRLPWSGSRRDFYGYFHAFYIYLLLARYLERALTDALHEAGEVWPLLDHVVSGLVQARDDVVVDERFTPAGARMITALMGELDGLTARLELLPEPVA